MALIKSNSFLLVLLPLSFLLTLHFKSSSSFYCTESFCEEYTSPYNTPCPEPKNCSNLGFRTFLDPDSACNCCEYCFEYLKENDVCETYTPKTPTKMCGPHLTCVKGEREEDPATCQKMIYDPMDPSNDNFCMKKRYDYEEAKAEGKLGIAQVYPECDADGLYAPRQCLPGNVCYCSNSAGERVFGLALPDQYQDCSCGRDIAKLQELGFTGKYPHCLPNGDYDELQCVVRTCFCRSHPEELRGMHALNELKCYNPEIHIFDPETPRYYFKDCEMEKARLEVLIAEGESEGRKTIIADMPRCDPDGSYASIQSDFDRLYCAFPENGTQIETYEATKFSKPAVLMNCYCARARYLLSNSANAKPRCCSNGNYRPWQCIGTRCFCVDHMGRQDPSKGQFNIDERDKLPCYPKHLEPGDGTDPECDYDAM